MKFLFNGLAMNQPDSTPVPRERFTVKLPVPVIERARNAVYWTSDLTLAGLTGKALEHYIDLLEAERGESFPPRTGELKLGRPFRIHKNSDGQ